MLIKNTVSVITSLEIGLVFDDESTKVRTIGVGDIIDVKYSHNGLTKTASGKITRIYTEPGHPGHVGHLASCSQCLKDGHWIILDASAEGASSVLRIDADTILDLDMIAKADAANVITSPAGCYNITSMRLVGSQVQISTDYGKTWYNLGEIEEPAIAIDPEYQELANKIGDALPDCINDIKKNETIKNLIDIFDQESKDDIDDPQS